MNMARIHMETYKQAFRYGKGSVAVVVPAQLGFKPGDMIKVTFESVEESDGKETE